MKLCLKIKNPVFDRVLELVNKSDIRALVISSEKEYFEELVNELYEISEGVKVVNHIASVYPCECGNRGSRRSCTCNEESLAYVEAEIRERSRENDIVVCIEDIKFEDIEFLEPSESPKLILETAYNHYNLTLDRLNKVVSVAGMIWASEESYTYDEAFEEAIDLCVNVSYNHASSFRGVT